MLESFVLIPPFVQDRSGPPVLAGPRNSRSQLLTQLPPAVPREKTPYTQEPPNSS